jgi:hypothetical protein
VSGGWGAYTGSGWGAAAAGAAVGAAAGLAVGASVAYLPSAAQTVVVNNENYFVGPDGTYYQPCYQGADLSYCVVDNPNY